MNLHDAITLLLFISQNVLYAMLALDSPQSNHYYTTAQLVLPCQDSSAVRLHRIVYMRSGAER